MNTAPRKLVVVLAGLYLLLVALFSSLALLLWLDMSEQERLAVLALLENRYGLAVFVILASWAVLGLIVQAIYKAYVQAPLSLREDALVILNANPQRRLKARGGPEIRLLAQTINALADQRDALKKDVEDKIREARASVEEEKNRLAALMSELAQSVVVCNLDGRILLYNNRARLQFKAMGDPAASAGALIGLGRSIFSVLDRSLIFHALDNLQHRLSRGGGELVSNFVTATRAGQLIRVQMAPVLSTPAGTDPEGDRVITGYVLVLENITRSVETESQRDQMLQALTEGSRASLANIRAAVENLLDYPDMDTAQRDRFLGVIAEEVRRLGTRLDQTVTEYADSLKTRWPLEEMLGADLIAAAQRRIESRLGILTKVEDVDSSLWVKVDSFSLIQGLTYLAARLKDGFDIREVRFSLARSGRLAHLDMLWSGTPIAVETLHTWELEPMNLGGETTPLTLRDVTDRHGGEIWYQLDKASHRAFFRLLVPVAVPREALSAAALMRGESRPEYYDFDLFRQTEETRELDDRLLSQLTYTAFDTETTGLQPSAGDEIIQIGAVRIVNGRLLRTEAFDQLINPQRPLAPESAAIHGITEAMLRDQPTIEQVLPAFYEFCEDTVLVAHNAAFDMRFLQLKEAATGVRFRQPVLDTLLLSAVIHPNQESHKLEAIAERLGVNIIGRHTALGDAIVTGEVFLKMIPLLAEMGIRTLREAREASERTYYARIQY
jgi:DNA polymerase-3 subunit epsilon